LLVRADLTSDAQVGLVDRLDPMAQSVLAYRWSQSEFVRAWEAGAFDHRVELVEGDLASGARSWHGDTVGQLLGCCRAPGCG
jgi:hypothetical protein